VVVKRGYKQTDVGVIPEEWEVSTIGSSLALINGRAFKPSDWKDRGLPIVRIQNLNDSESTFNYWPGPVDERYIIDVGDLLFAWSGTTGTSFGARVWKGPRAILNQHIFRVVPDESRLTPEFAFLVLQTVQADIEKRAHGFKASFVHVKKSDLKGVALPVPTFAEQRAIAAALSDADALIASLDRLIAKKRDLKQAAMQQLLTGQTRLPGFGGKGGYKQTEVGRVPADWKVAQIKEHASIKTGKRNTQDNVPDGRYPFFVRSQNVERINSYSYDGEAVLTAGDGVGTGKVFHYVNGRFDFHQRVYRISDFSSELNGFYFYLYFSAHFYDRIMSMTAKSSVDSVRLEMIADMAIPLPSHAEQSAIAAVLSDMDAELTALEERRDKSKLVKQGMMQELLTGRTRLV
jgi:type I restriction enzyme S subunit